MVSAFMVIGLVGVLATRLGRASRPHHGKIEFVFARRARFGRVRLLPMFEERIPLADGQTADIGDVHQDGVASDGGEVEPFRSAA